jgi:hypothetical protein
MNMFSADSRILDGDVFDWDGDRYQVRLYPAELGQIEVRVTMLDDTGASTFTYWVKRCRPWPARSAQDRSRRGRKEG